MNIINFDITNLNVTYNLTKYRMEAGLTQKELAQITGIGKSTISDIENNKAHPTIPVILILCIVLEIQINKIINYKLII